MSLQWNWHDDKAEGEEYFLARGGILFTHDVRFTSHKSSNCVLHPPYSFVKLLLQKIPILMLDLGSIIAMIQGKGVLE